MHLDITNNIKYNSANVLAIEILRPFNPNKEDDQSLCNRLRRLDSLSTGL